MGAALNSIIATAFRSANSSPGPGASFLDARDRRQELDSILAAREQQADLRGLQMEAARNQMADRQATMEAIGTLTQPEPDYQAQVHQQYGLPVDEGIGGAVTQEGFNQYAQAIQNQVAEREAANQAARNTIMQRNPELAMEQLFQEGPEWSEPVSGGQLQGGDPNKFYQRNTKTGQWKQIGGGGMTVKVPVSVSGANEKGLEVFAKEAVTQLNEQRQGVRDAEGTMLFLGRAKDLVRQGVISGTAADMRLSFARGLETLGFGDGSAARTQEYIAATAKLVGDVIKLFGSGTGLSDRDLEFAKIMAGGEVSLTPKAMLRIIDLNARAQARKFEVYNETISAIPDDFASLRGLYRPVVVPTFDYEPSVLEGIPGVDELSPAEQGRLEAHLLANQ
jgi:hypothetical protein